MGKVMDPQVFLNKWQITHQFLAVRLGVDERTVRRWTASPKAKFRTIPPNMVLISILTLDQLWEAQGKKPGQTLLDLIRETTAA